MENEYGGGPLEESSSACWQPATSGQVPKDTMEPVSHGIIFWLIVGGIAGALAGRIVEGSGFGIVVDIIVGIVGALGLHLGSGIIGSLITALVGAVILLALLRLFSRGRAGINRLRFRKPGSEAR
jgi:uncharacterized membrane protein YeaQ/YmgE (transglycosylase-associated protein family)